MIPFRVGFRDSSFETGSLLCPFGHAPLMEIGAVGKRDYWLPCVEPSWVGRLATCRLAEIEAHEPPEAFSPLVSARFLLVGQFVPFSSFVSLALLNNLYLVFPLSPSHVFYHRTTCTAARLSSALAMVSRLCLGLLALCSGTRAASKWRLVAPRTNTLSDEEPPSSFDRRSSTILPIGVSSGLDSRPALLHTNKFYSNFVVRKLERAIDIEL